MTSPERTSRQRTLANHLLRISLITVGAALLLYFVSIGTLKEMAVTLAGTIIEDVVERESDGFYQVAFSKIEINLLSRELEFQNFRLLADSASRSQFEQGLPGRENMYLCHIPLLRMQIRSLYNLYFNRVLHVSSIELTEPEVQWHKNRKQDREVTLSLEAGDFYQLVTEYLYHFEITDFKIENGNFLYIRNTGQPDVAYRVGPVNASVKNFEIDQHAGIREDKFLNTDNLFLQIKDQTVKLSDSLHIVSFDELTLSTETSDVVFHNLRLKPREDKLPIPDSLNSFNVLIPLFQIQGIDFVEAYNDNILDIGEIYFEAPVIDIYEVNNTKRRAGRSGPPANSISDLITSLFDAVAVENFSLNNALLDLKFYAGKNQDRFTVQNARVKLTDFSIDTATVVFSRDTKLFEHIDFTMDHYAYFLPDSIHRLHIKSFRFSTLDSLITGDSLVIAPMEGLKEDKLPDRADMLKEFYVPSFELSGVELWKGWEQKDLAVRKLEVAGSDFYLKRLNDPKKELSFREIANFYPYVKDVFTSISVDSLVVGSSEVDIYDRSLHKFASPDIAVYATAFRVDSLTQLDSTNFFHASDLLLKVGKTRFVLPDESHILEVGDFSFNSIRGDYAAKDVVVTPYYPAGWSARGTIGSIKMTSFFLKEFLDEGKWLADSVFLFEPDLQVTLLKKGRRIKNSALSQAEVENLEVRDGELALNLGDTTNLLLSDYYFSLGGLKYDLEKDMDWDVKNANADIASLSLQLARGQRIRLESIWSSVEDSVFTSREFSFNSPAGDGVQHFSSPSLSISGLDILGMIKGQHLKWRDATIAPARVIWQQPAQKTGKPLAEVLGETKRGLLGDFGYLKGQKLKSPVMSFTYKNGQTQDSILNVHLVLSDIYFDPRTAVLTAPPGFAGNIELKLSGQSLGLAGNFDSLSFESLSVETKKREIALGGLYLRETNPDKTSFEFVVPHLKMGGINWKKLLFENELQADSLYAELSSVSIESWKKQLGKKEELLHFDWKSESLKSIYIDNLSLDGKSFAFYQKEAEKTWRVPEYNLQLKDFQIASGASVSGKNLLFSNDHSVVLKDLSYLLPDSLYRIQADQLILSSGQPEIRLEGFRLLPRYGMYEHAHVVGHQTSWVMLRARSVALSQADLYEMLNGGEWQAARVEVEEPFLRVFRDKRVPFPDWQVRDLPHLQLQQLAQVVHVDSLYLRNGKIIYLEFAADGSEPGQLVFSDFNARLSNVTNIPEKIRYNPYISLHANALAMEQGPIRLDVVFDLDSKAGLHYVSGSLGSLDLLKTNSMLQPVAYLEVVSGKLDEAYFNFEADTAVAVGTMDFFYKDLKVSVLNKKDQTKKGLGKSLETFLANTFIVNSNNPSFLVTREGYIFSERDTSRSIINYWAKAFLSGVISSIGAKSNKDKIKQWKEEVYEKNTLSESPHENR